MKRKRLLLMAAIATIALVVASVLVATAVAAALRRAHERRCAAVRRRYVQRRRGSPVQSVHFESALGAAFCDDAAARLPPVPRNAPVAQAFGADPFWASSLEWMTNQVAGIARCRLYWVEAWVVSPLSLWEATHSFERPQASPLPDGCMLVIDLLERRVLVTTARPLPVASWTEGRASSAPFVLALLDSRPRAFCRRLLPSFALD